MPNRIYTQADYDRVTDMYNTYQNTKDRYTPEQQQQIESMFGKARNEVSNRIEDSNSRTSNFVDPSVLQDAQVNGFTREQMDAKWGPGAADLAGVTKTAPTRTVTPRNTVPPTNNTQPPKPNVPWDIDKYGVVGPQDEDPVPNQENTQSGFDTTGWFRTSDGGYASPDLTTKIGADGSVYMGEPIYDPAIIGSYKLNNDGTAQFVSGGGSVSYVSDPAEFENMRNTLKPRQKEGWEYLQRYSKDFRRQVQTILNSGGYIDEQGYLHRQDGSVITKL